jgi:hypothetical protein
LTPHREPLFRTRMIPSNRETGRTSDVPVH